MTKGIAKAFRNKMNNFQSSPKNKDLLRYEKEERLETLWKNSVNQLHELIDIMQQDFLNNEQSVICNFFIDNNRRIIEQGLTEFIDINERTKTTRMQLQHDLLYDSGGSTNNDVSSVVTLRNIASKLVEIEKAVSSTNKTATDIKTATEKLRKINVRKREEYNRMANRFLQLKTDFLNINNISIFCGRSYTIRSCLETFFEQEQLIQQHIARPLSELSNSYSC